MAAAALQRRITFFGTPVDLLSRDETISLARNAMEGGAPVRHTALNVAKLIKLRTDDLLAEDVNSSDVVGIDGKGIVIGLRAFGVRSAERVAGVDLFLDLLDLCARTGRKPYILGATDKVLATALERARQLYPGLKFAGYRNGYFSADEAPSIAGAIRESGADCLFVAMPTPHKERFLRSYAESLRVPFVMGVGGSVDVLAGHVSRAPRWMQRNGLEWLHRMLKQPRKMLWRYLSTNSAYAWLLMKTKLTGRNPVERL